MPEVFDRIAETARRVGEDGDATPRSDATTICGPIVVEQSSDDGCISVMLEDGKLTGLRFDEATARRRVSTMAEDLVTLVNNALQAHERATLKDLESSATGFGALVAHLGELQKDLHHAYVNDLRRLDG